MNVPMVCKKDGAVENRGVSRGEEKDVVHHSEDTREEKAIAALTPAVSEEGNGNRYNISGSIGRNGHELCKNRTITHAADDGGCKVGQAGKNIAKNTIARMRF